jgi:hypothetical protein
MRLRVFLLFFFGDGGTVQYSTAWHLSNVKNMIRRQMDHLPKLNSRQNHDRHSDSRGNPAMFAIGFQKDRQSKGSFERIYRDDK